jgi:hypothetical protein
MDAPLCGEDASPQLVLFVHKGASHGPWNFTLDVRRSSSDHFAAGHVITSLAGVVMIETPPAPPALDETTRLRSNSAASWEAILAGAVVAVSLSLVLVTLGAGLGFA